VPRTRTVRYGPRSFCFSSYRRLETCCRNINISREQFKPGLRTRLLVQAYTHRRRLGELLFTRRCNLQMLDLVDWLITCLQPIHCKLCALACSVALRVQRVPRCTALRVTSMQLLTNIHLCGATHSLTRTEMPCTDLETRWRLWIDSAWVGSFCAAGVLCK